MLPLALRAVAAWSAPRWGVAMGAAVLTTFAIGLPTAVIPNPLFARSVATPWWGWPVLVATALLAGVLLATYVRTGIRTAGAEAPTEAPTEALTGAETGTGPDTGTGTGTGTGSGTEPEARGASDAGGRRASRLGTAGGVLSFLAVGCPVCNKLVLLALGTSGALSVWQPLQPVLAVASLALLAVATVRRLAGEIACPVATG